MDKLTIERTQPVQGKQVEATVLWNEEHIGDLYFDFTAWLKFKRLLEKGMEMDTREDHGLKLKLVIKAKEARAVGEAYPQGRQPYAEQNTEVVQAPYRGGISNLAAEDEQDAEDLAAIAAAEAGAMPVTMPVSQENSDEIAQGLIRCLRREES